MCFTSVIVATWSSHKKAAKRVKTDVDIVEIREFTAAIRHCWSPLETTTPSLPHKYNLDKKIVSLKRIVQKMRQVLLINSW